MSQPTCSRVWEVEAARDGRLSGEALASHERHRAECGACKREAQVFGGLAAALGEGVAVDQVALRRLRGEVLKAAHSLEPRTEPGRSRGWRYVMAMVSVIVLAAVILLALRTERAPAATNSVIATPIGEARWSRTGHANAERIVLEAGTLDLSVQHAGNGQRLVVQVPDGEIEDVGTRFQVVVADKTTRSIVVSEGVVIFHRPGAADVRVGAGERWANEPAPAGEPPPASTSAVSAGASPSEPQRDALRVAPNTATRHPSPSAAAVTATHGSTSSSAEDSAYLGVLSLLRQGRTEDARSAARKYLTDFPRGFRRVEMERVAR